LLPIAAIILWSIIDGLVFITNWFQYRYKQKKAVQQQKQPEQEQPEQSEP
jgi:hypothetical protein